MADSIRDRIREFLDQAKKNAQGAGWVDEKTGGRHVTPWAWRTQNGLWVGWDGAVWMYRALELSPWTWADQPERLRYGAKISDLFADIVSVTPPGVLPEQIRSSNREFHLVNLTWDTPARPPEANTPELREYQHAALGGRMTPRRVVLMGVRLRPRGGGGPGAVNKDGVAGKIKDIAIKVLGEDVPELDAYEADRKEMEMILTRAGGRMPTREETMQLESWYNLGRGPEARIIEEWDHLVIDDFDEIQMAAISDFHRPQLTAPYDTWLLDALNHQESPHVVSIRGRLQPPAQARARARRALRWAYDQMAEEAKAGDVERREIDDIHAMAKTFDDHFAETRYPLLTEVSIVLARRVHADVAETYAEELRTRYDIEVTPLLGRQLAALDETLPCSVKRVNPYPQDLSSDMVGFAGVNAWSGLGDTEGALIGLTAEDGVPVYLDPLGAPKANQPASMAIFGDSGGGKTHLMLNIAVQAVLGGYPTTFINPKGADTLASALDLVGGRRVSMAEIEEEGGYFDPFRFTEPHVAADIAATHILSVLTGFTQEQQILLRSGLMEGAKAGARCVGDALKYVNDEDVKRQVGLAANSDPRFALGIGWTPREEFQMDRRLTLIEFDRDLDLPSPDQDRSTYSMSQRSSLAAMQLVVRVSLEQMAGKTGGVLMVDEAWTFLNQAESRAALEGLGRKGRSLNVLPVLATQKVADLLQYDMESLLSRVFILSMRDPREAAAALQLAGLEPRQDRIEFLADCGPRRMPDGTVRIPLAVHRDLLGRSGVVVLGPIPPRALEAFSTNPEDRKKREEKLRAAQATPAASGVVGAEEADDDGLHTAFESYEAEYTGGRGFEDPVNTPVAPAPIHEPAPFAQPVTETADEESLADLFGGGETASRSGEDGGELADLFAGPDTEAPTPTPKEASTPATQPEPTSPQDPVLPPVDDDDGWVDV